MRFNGKITGAAINVLDGTLKLEIQADKSVRNNLDNLMKCDLLDIEIKKHRERRSLDANALLWACLGDIAAAIKSDKWAVYLEMLKRYGKYTYIVVKKKAVEKVKQQWRECEVVGEVSVNGEKAVQMLCYFGSSLYDTKEFSVLLDGVISEMKEMGLEVPTGRDMQRALDMWEKRLGKNEET